ncbi:hypothetical protein D3C73_975010 [compost metagenome]
MGRTLQMGIEHRHLPTVTQRQVAHQQGVSGFELAAERIARDDGQLQALGMFDPVTAQGCQLPADAAEDMRVRYEVGLPVEGADTAWVQIGEPFLQQFELVLVIAGLGAVVQFLQQHDVRLFVANHPRHFVEAEGHVFRCGAFVGTSGQVIPEHVTLAGQVLNVPGHHFQCLPGDQGGGLGTATDGQLFIGVGAPGQAVGHHGDQADHDQQAQQGVAQ